jgi:hypothetical protein
VVASSDLMNEATGRCSGFYEIGRCTGAMPSFANLPEQQRWQIITFLLEAGSRTVSVRLMKIIRVLIEVAIFFAGICFLLEPFISLWQTNKTAFEKIAVDGGAVFQYLKSVSTAPFYWFTTALGIAFMYSAKRFATEIGKSIGNLTKKKDP